MGNTEERPLPVAAKRASERALSDGENLKRLLNDAGMAELVSKLACGPLDHFVGTGLSEPYLVTYSLRSEVHWFVQHGIDMPCSSFDRRRFGRGGWETPLDPPVLDLPPLRKLSVALNNSHNMLE